MTRIRFIMMLVGASCLQSTPHVSQAQEFGLEPVPVLDLLDEDSALIERISYEQGGGSDGSAIFDGSGISDATTACCGSGCNNKCCRSGGCFGGGELTFLKLGNSEGRVSGYDYDASQRYWLGYQRQDGLGARIRWFDYEDSNPNAPSITSVDIDTLDFEATDVFQLGKWKGLLSGGVRIAWYEEIFFNNPNDRNEFNAGIGPVIGIEMSRCVCNNLSAFGLFRESIIVDDEETNAGDDFGYSITELQVGGEFRRPLQNCCAEVFLRSAFEAQFWSGVSERDSDSTSLIGGTIAIGIRR